MSFATTTPASFAWDRYGEIDGLSLSRLTHAPGSPWHQITTRGTQTQIIPNHVIRDYYAGFIRLRENQCC